MIALVLSGIIYLVQNTNGKYEDKSLTELKTIFKSEYSKKNFKEAELVLSYIEKLSPNSKYSSSARIALNKRLTEKLANSKSGGTSELRASQKIGGNISQDYEIIEKQTVGTLVNYRLYYKPKKFDKKSLLIFCNTFRKLYCPSDCNIELYNTPKVKNLINKYPLNDKEHIWMADRFIGWQTFDNPNQLFWYPFQDLEYKENGGKNWKKD